MIEAMSLPRACASPNQNNKFNNHRLDEKEEEPTLEWILTIAAIGLLSIFAEAFLPGGVLGVMGWLLIGTSLVATYRLWGFTTPFFLLLVGLLAGGIALYVIAIRIVPKTAIGKVIFLRTTQKGYNVSVQKDREMIGKEGFALSFLRPTGIAEVDGRRVNVVTEGEFIEKNTRIKVCELKDNYLVVRRAASQPDKPPGQT